ncbi:T9SS-dependent M36 family metallopeptidase [Aquimarina litoralis]|uniref:T9SS-dependent M36 family metallopeptidase n=1 Tax=Aquimarina litoralis TaxID=584605 RepID=UPI001C596B07|nr:T9SS-dependent M36 family metallopeptidase [Aquimarina litoralis]MBW1296167.1 T9SS type A sorting domain-containing protein [Aquimarina litoralis]
MNKNYFKFLIFLLGINIGIAQDQSNVDIVKDYLISSGMNRDDVSDLKVQSESFSNSMNVANVYVNQQYRGIAIKNVVGNFAIRNGKVVHYSGKLINNLESKVITSNADLNPRTAVIKAAAALQLPNISNVSIVDELSQNKFIVSRSNISFDEIPVELVYEYIDDKLVLAWDLSIHALDGNNWYSVRVDATTGELTSENNWMTSCTFDHSLSNNKHSDHNHKKISDFGFKSKSLAKPFLMDGSYNVFAVPSIESPNHGNRTIVTNPVNAVASPFGWHDTDGVAGAEFTTTQGNNVLAAEDLDGDNLPGNQPDGGANLIFDFPYDPATRIADYQNASLTNLFYVSNVIHDVWYQYGFDEASGNFQFNNYGKGGVDGDEVFADGQDGSGTNNATFGTPPDGANPRMSMFLWNPENRFVFTVNNTSLAGTYNVVNNAFRDGSIEPPFLPAGITGDLILAVDDNATPDSSDACSLITNTAEMNGNIAVVRRGECNFSVKVIEAQRAGATAVIVVNNVAGDVTMGGDGSVFINIPAFSINQADGEALITQMASGSVNATLASELREDWIVGADGSFDNGIVVHEYGHGISTRLTGGASNSGCLSGAEQMGEGWSDWFALMMTIEPGDTGEDARGIGTYAIGQPTTGGGIRPFPYSTNTTTNPVTYASISDATRFSVPHGVGSVWAAILWDMTWAFIERDGYDPDLYNGTGGNNLAMQLVIDGLKLQACNPGFVDGRDGILAAADLLPNSTANKCIIWNVFAARGVGYSADQGFSSSRTDQTEAFDLPPTSELDCSNVLGVDDFNGGVFEIYPNPSKGTFDIQVAQSLGVSTISVFDMNGRVVYKESKQLNTTHRITTNLDTGIYLLRIEAENGSAIKTTKIIVE